jgi:hypothetical protein
MAGAGARRDPVSESFDASARRQLNRAFALGRGHWVSFWLPDPTPQQIARWRQAGIRVNWPDPQPKGGGLDARTRWARAFVRSLNYQVKWYAPTRGSSGLRGIKRTVPSGVPLRVEIGRHLPGSPGGGLPPRRRVRIMVAPGGQAKHKAVTRLANRDRIYTDAGTPAARWADPSRRDW